MDQFVKSEYKGMPIVQDVNKAQFTVLDYPIAVQCDSLEEAKMLIDKVYG